MKCDANNYFVENALKIIAEKCKILHNNKSYAIVFLRMQVEAFGESEFPFEGNNTKMIDLYFLMEKG